MKHPLTKTQNVLNRMRKAFEKGKGIVIRPDELQEMSISIFGDLWKQEDPNKNLTLHAPDLACPPVTEHGQQETPSR